jgi:hypothetical protein
MGLLAVGGVAGLTVRGARTGLFAPAPADPTGFLPEPGSSDLSSLVSTLALAPSAMNSQPWSVDVREDGALALRMDRARLTGPLDADLVEGFMGLGCATETLRVAGAGAGRPVRVTVLPNPDDLTLAALLEASPDGSEPSAPDDARLFDALARRRTWRGDMRTPADEPGAQLPPPEMPASEGRIRWFDGGAAEQVVRTLAADSAGVLAADPAVAAGVDRWLRLDPTVRHRDGLEIEDLGLTTLSAVRTRLFPPQASDQRVALWRRGPGRGGEGGRWGAFYAPPDGSGRTWTADSVRERQVRAGMTWMRFWLRATAAGLAIQPVNAPLRLADWLALNGGDEIWEERIRDVLALEGRLPSVVFRLGVPTGGAQPRGPRRDVESIQGG